MKSEEQDEDYKMLHTYYNNSLFGDYVLRKINDNNGLGSKLTEVLKKYFNSSSDGSTYRESFITFLVSVIGTFDVLNEFLSIYGGEYQIVPNMRYGFLYKTKFCVYSGEGDTHYNSCTPTGGVYDPYDYNHQIPYTHGFCQTFSVYNTIKDNVGKEYEMKEYDYVNNSYKALQFISFILDTKSKVFRKILTNSINEVYKEKNNYDLKSSSKLTLFKIKKIIEMYSKIDIYPGILSSAEDVGYDEKLFNKFKAVDN
jgi:hypothetical protein